MFLEDTLPLTMNWVSEFMLSAASNAPALLYRGRACKLGAMGI